MHSLALLLLCAIGFVHANPTEPKGEEPAGRVRTWGDDGAWNPESEWSLKKDRKKRETCETTQLTDKNSLLGLTSNAQVSNVDCGFDSTYSSTCDNLPQLAHQAPGLGFYASPIEYASVKITFGSAATTTWTFTRWDNWDQSCRVVLLRNGGVVGEVPPDVGEDNGHKATVTVNVNAGESVELFEGYNPDTHTSDGSSCGAILYSISVCAYGDRPVGGNMDGDHTPTCSGDPSTNWDCCTNAAPCVKGNGDCDFDTDCAGDLYCGEDNCLLYHSTLNSAWETTTDCCTDVNEHEINAVELSSTGTNVVTNIGRENFNQMFATNPIVQYTRNGLVHSVYKRITAVPSGFDAYALFTFRFSSTNNLLNTDFEIYNSIEDMEALLNRWDFCNYNEDDEGFPRDCGKTGQVFNEWFSMPGGLHNAMGLSSGASFQLFGELPPDSTYNDGSNDWATMVPSPIPQNAIDGGWGHWSPYGACSVDCGGGLQNRTRCCDNPWPMYGGYDCLPSGNIMHIEYEDCNIQTCAIHCVWDNWVDGTCSLPCGTGTRVNTRVKLVNESMGGSCSGDWTETEICNAHDCPVDCEWDAWVDGSCSLTCGGGYQTDTRQVLVYMVGTGENCTGNSEVTISCNTQECPIDGGWSEWAPWGYCSATCGGGDQTRVRYCNNPSPEYGGLNCTDTYTDCQRCNEELCPSTCPPAP